MSTKRRAIDRSKPPGGGGGPFTPEIIATFKRLMELDDDDSEYRAVCRRLDTLLGFDEPWDRFSPAYVGDGGPPARMREHERVDWDRAVEVRRQLERAVAQERPENCPDVAKV